MFLVVPKPKANAATTASVDPSFRPLAEVTRGGRVQTACDRCRLKKVKCDGDVPCLRCSQDAISCIVTKKAHTDSKGMMKDYVQSIELQQKRLIQALQKVDLLSRRSICQGDMREIVKIVKEAGFNFKEAPTMPSKPSIAAAKLNSKIVNPDHGAVHEPATVDAVHGAQIHVQTASDNHAHIAPRKRRKRGIEPHEDLPTGSDSTESVVNIDMPRHVTGEFSYPKILPSADAYSVSSSDMIDSHQSVSNFWAEHNKPDGQSKPVDSWPDIGMGFGLSNENRLSSANDTPPFEPQASSIAPPDHLSMLLLPTDLDAQAIELNDIEVPLNNEESVSETFDLQSVFDWDSTISWDPSLLLELRIDGMDSEQTLN